MLHVARWKYRTQKIAKNSPSGHHRTTFSGCIFATTAHIDNRKKLLNSSVSPTCSHNMVNFGALAAEIGSRVWTTPANVNGFRILALLLQRRRSLEANKSVWRSPELVHAIYIFGALAPNGILPIHVQVLRSPILAALLHGTPAAGVSQASRHGTRNGITQLSAHIVPL